MGVRCGRGYPRACGAVATVKKDESRYLRQEIAALTALVQSLRAPKP
jgi:hypothetical protein